MALLLLLVSGDDVSISLAFFSGNNDTSVSSAFFSGDDDISVSSGFFSGDLEEAVTGDNGAPLTPLSTSKIIPILQFLSENGHQYTFLSPSPPPPPPLCLPCKTFLISIYSVAELRSDLFVVVVQVHEFHRTPLDFPRFRPRALDDPQTLIFQPQIAPGSTSILHRSIDILRVLASILFGAACGVLTGAPVYLVWSIFNCRFVAYRSYDHDFIDDDEDEDDDIFNPKKIHQNELCKPANPSPSDSVETALLEKESV